MGFTPEIAEGSPFTLENIPFGVVSTSGSPETHCATAIGDFALDLRALSKQGAFKDKTVADTFTQPDLGSFAALQVCAPMSAGKIPDNFFNAPSAYNGRASSVRPSPHGVHRPKGVYWDPFGSKSATYAASKALDYELEMGFIVSKPLPYGKALDINSAAEHIFGFVLLNDWSARDIQVFEMPPLGPFNSKAFGTTISPWVITLDALKPFSCPPKHPQTLSPLEHLRYGEGQRGTFDIKLEAHLVRNGTKYKLCSSNLSYLLWTPYQQLTQQASSMCGLRTGDLIGTGTVSGDAVENGKKVELACLFEATLNGTVPYKFEDGQELTYLQDEDGIVLSARCVDSNGKTVLGFGDCAGQIVRAG
ncbi:Fumarylacetoacetase [Botryosphaeria dothidea]|uniref:Fumarylacetoacetase n=1 Tax=Botryosphaeria dothidea TaxID=55169 RepID=A0A8H4N7W4_9PEZI|nr:Fumarylacetoacetase [Botryosphaeria dothidea]